jgi:hypothetical protein
VKITTAFGRGDGVLELESFVTAHVEPGGNGRGGQTQHPDPHPSHLENRIGLEQGLAIEQRVGRKKGEVGGFSGRRENLQAKVELVIADRHGIVAKQIHHLDRGIGLVGKPSVRHQLERRSLDAIAPVEEQRFRIPGSLGAHQRGQERQPVGCRLVAEVPLGMHVAVQIRGVKNGDRDLLLRRHGAARHCQPEERCGQKYDRPRPC